MISENLITFQNIGYLSATSYIQHSEPNDSQLSIPNVLKFQKMILKCLISDHLSVWETSFSENFTYTITTLYTLLNIWYTSFIEIRYLTFI